MSGAHKSIDQNASTDEEERSRAKGSSHRLENNSGDERVQQNPFSGETLAGPEALKQQKDYEACKEKQKPNIALPEVQLVNHDDLVIAGHYQNRMIGLFDQISGWSKLKDIRCAQGTMAVESNSNKNPDSPDELLAERKRALLKEQENKVWGPASQSTFRDYIQWMENVEVPKMNKELVSAGLNITGNPVLIPENANGKVLSDADFAKALSAGTVKVDLGVKVGEQPRVPSIDEVPRIEAAAMSVDRAQAELNQNFADQRYRQDKSAIGNGVPEGWKLRPEQDENEYRLALSTGVSLYNQLHAAAVAATALNKLGEHFDLPPGISTIPNEENKFHIELPQNLSELRTDPMVEQYIHWLEENAPRIEKDDKALKAVEQNPYLNMMIATVPETAGSNDGGEKVSKKAVLDSNSHLTKVIDPLREFPPAPTQASDGKPAENFTTENCDVTRRSFTATRVNPDDPNSDISATVTVQAEQARIGYDLFNKPVGKPLVIEKTYKADEPVVYNGKLVEAKTLPDLCLGDNLAKNAGLLVELGWDLSMLGTGVGNLLKLRMLAGPVARAAVDESVAAVAGTTAAAAAGETNLAAVHAAAESLMGVGGIVGSNSWGNENAPWIDTTRGLYFSAMMMASPSMRFNNFYSGSEDFQLALKQTGPKWLQKITESSQLAMRTLTPISVSSMLYESGQQWRRNWLRAPHAKSEDPGIVAMAASEGALRHTLTAAVPPSAQESPELEQLRRIGQDYKEQFKPQSLARKSVDEIFDTVANFSKLSEAEKAAARQKWATDLVFARDEIATLDIESHNELSADNLRDLIDPQIRALMPEKVRTIAEQIQASKEMGGLKTPDTSNLSDEKRAKIQQERHLINTEVATAERMALLMTANSEDGALPGVLASVTVHRNMHYVDQQTSTFGLKHLKQLEVKSAEIPENLDSQAIINGLREDMRSLGTGSSRGMAIADLLARTGSISSHQYSSIVQEKLRNSQVSEEDKLKLLRMTEGPTVTSLLESLYAEQQLVNEAQLDPAAHAALDAANFTSGYKDLLNTLATTSQSDPSETVRALSATTYYAARKLVANMDETITTSSEIAALERNRNELQKDANVPGSRLLTMQYNEEISEKEVRYTQLEQEKQQIIENLNGDLKGLTNCATAGHLIAPLKTQVLADLSAPLPEGDELSPWAMQKRLNAIDALSMTTPNGPLNGTDSDKVMEALKELVSKANPEQIMYMTKSLPSPLLAKLTEDNTFSSRLLSLMPEANSTRYKNTDIDFLGEMGKFAPGSSPQFRNELETKLKELIECRSSNANFPDIQKAAIKLASTAKIKGVCESLERLISDTANTSALSREAALNAVISLRDPKLFDNTEGSRALIDGWLEHERDQRIHSQLQSLKNQISGKPKNTDATANTSEIRAVENFPDMVEIANAYPLISKFDAETQRKFLHDNKLELLDHDMFVTEAQRTVQSDWGKTSLLGLDFLKENPEESMNKLQKQREEQFQKLVLIAQGKLDTSPDSMVSPASQMARLFLAHMAVSGGRPTASDYNKYILAVNHDAGAIKPYYYDEASHPARTNRWDVDAANALIKLANDRTNGFGLNRYLIGDLLSKRSELDIATINALVDTWQKMSHS